MTHYTLALQTDAIQVSLYCYKLKKYHPFGAIGIVTQVIFFPVYVAWYYGYLSYELPISLHVQT